MGSVSPFCPRSQCDYGTVSDRATSGGPSASSWPLTPQSCRDTAGQRWPESVSHWAGGSPGPEAMLCAWSGVPPVWEPAPLWGLSSQDRGPLLLWRKSSFSVPASLCLPPPRLSSAGAPLCPLQEHRLCPLPSAPALHRLCDLCDLGCCPRSLCLSLCAWIVLTVTGQPPKWPSRRVSD